MFEFILGLAAGSVGTIVGLLYLGYRLQKKETEDLRKIREEENKLLEDLLKMPADMSYQPWVPAEYGKDTKETKPEVKTEKGSSVIEVNFGYNGRDSDGK